ncbi:DNA helicase IV [Motilibacter rhizosphaerae]|uniref:DNA helicase IV n=1 Tax=Motilibacter rhizosphaerae TaxID=598652 RepID=A0A4Q7NQA0_9ACTN|nr:ATP-binding domain-containing protein [Motilibacter rhizosphaerae]RZS87469.1 DNA helicase IV [Motilibacter rhizosphaerae]
MSAEQATGSSELAREREHVALLYARLDELRERTAAQLDAVRRQEVTGTHQNRSERDAFATLHTDRLAQLWAVENGLCFGRLDRAEGDRLYVGRLGLSDDQQDQLQVDWRTPAAQAFYRATAAHPEGVVRRRHISTRGRVVTGVDDEVLDLDALSEADKETLNGEAALLAALAARRTGRMGDIVATIQAEQDRIIRDELDGILVVQGGPGTGKTAVALHRAAYLLYTYRDRLARRGVLVIGPNPAFLRYIEQVLPSLGETDVLLTSAAGLFPGVEATAEDEPEVARLKGDLRMVDVVAAAVRDRQRLPRGGRLELSVDGDDVVLDRQVVDRARQRARRSRRPHNLARRTFVREVVAALSTQIVAKRGAHLLDDEDLAEIRAELRTDPDVREALDGLWPHLTPQRLLAELYADRGALSRACRDVLTAEETALLARPSGSPWTVGDVALLDEAAELLGSDADPDEEEALRREQERRERAYAEEVLGVLGLDGYVSAEQLASRYAAAPDYLTTAERAAGDREWAFGHVVVDEAQELSPMAWRLVMRRCPTKSMTLVGDVAQTAALAGARSWQEVLEPHAGTRWRQAELTVNYRTPAEVMELANRVLAGLAPGVEPARAVRESGEPPVVVAVPAGALAERVAVAAAEEQALVGEGKVAVLAPASLLPAVRAAVAAAVPDAVVEGGPKALDAPVAVLSVRESKGLEFDSVVVVEPAGLVAGSARGTSDLYVALTRTTRRLTVVHAEPLPDALR